MPDHISETYSTSIASDNPIHISVIIPTYNASQLIGEALNGLLKEADASTEFIVVDDGSTDDTRIILGGYAEQYSNLQVIHQGNAGAGAARNRGMDEAQGEYLAFLDADDLYEPKMLQIAYECARHEQSDVVVWRSDSYLEDEDCYRPAPGSIKKELLPDAKPFSLSDVKRDAFRVFIGWPWDKLFRADFIRKNGIRFQEQRTTNDLLFVYSALVRAARISIVEEVLAHHRHSTGTLSVTREQSWTCFYVALTALRQQLCDWGIWERYEQDFVNYALHSSLWNLTTLRGDAYAKLYERLHDEWFTALGIEGRDDDYFYHPDDLAAYHYICEHDVLDYTLWRVLQVEDSLRAKQNENRELRKKVKSLRRQLERIKTSRSYRLGRILTHPVRKILRGN